MAEFDRDTPPTGPVKPLSPQGKAVFGVLGLGFGRPFVYPIKFLIINLVYVGLALLYAANSTQHQNLVIASGFVAWLVASLLPFAMFFVVDPRGRGIRLLTASTIFGWFIVFIAQFAADVHIGRIAT